MAMPDLHLHQPHRCGHGPLLDVRLVAAAARPVAPPHSGAAAWLGAWQNLSCPCCHGVLTVPRGCARRQVPRPPPALTAGQWREKVASAASRLHAREMCPICQDPFADRDQVILSCEHAYHRSCLETFERFSSLRGQAPTCPVCRAKDYQKHLTHVGRETHREVCALQIQVRAVRWTGGRGNPADAV